MDVVHAFVKILEIDPGLDDLPAALKGACVNLVDVYAQHEEGKSYADLANEHGVSDCFGEDSERGGEQGASGCCGGVDPGWVRDVVAGRFGEASVERDAGGVRVVVKLNVWLVRAVAVAAAGALVWRRWR